MVVGMVLLTIIVFILVDVFSRLAMKRIQENRERKARERALDIGLRLEYTDEAPSLKRIEVDHPKARVLAVDDEPIILDSFRKILVMAGYAVDTVESGPEALGLIQKHDYDFVFTDLKMPDMDGLDVTKAVKHLRPDIDVIMITGFATIESAVAAMKFGAMDYVQKPFTADELVEFVNTSWIRRQDRQEREVRPHVHLVTPTVGTSFSKREVNVPAGVFVAPEHTWISLHADGLLLIGIDDLAQKILGPIDEVELPEIGQLVAKGAPLFTIIHGEHRLTFVAPAGGRVASVNADVLERPALINRKPYEAGWLCGIDPENLPEDLQTLRIGADAVAWYQGEIERYQEVLHALDAETAGDRPDERNGAATWEAFSQSFLHA